MRGTWHRRKTRQTTRLQDLPKTVVITRKQHPFEGQSLSVIHSIRRRGVRLVLVILPNGTRSLIPAAWADWITEPVSTPTSHISYDLGRLDDLLHLRRIINALLSRPSETEPPASSIPTNSPTTPWKHIDETARMAALEFLARLLAHMLAAPKEGETP